MAGKEKALKDISLYDRIKTAVQSFFARLRPSETVIFAFASVLVGLGSGIGVWLFFRLIKLVNQLYFSLLGGEIFQYGAWTIILIPCLGGLVVGLVARFFIYVHKEMFAGVAGIKKAVALEGGRLHYRQAPARVIASILSIGSGASVGPEDPAVQIGSNFGSMVGQVFQLTPERIRALTAAGAAGGIAATFNAPIAGVFFAMEVILGGLGGRSFGFIGLAAVTSTVFTQAAVGREPAFPIPHYTYNSMWELPLYFALGLITGPVAAFYARLIHVMHDRFDKWNVPRLVKPITAGFILGIVAIWLPEVMGFGYDTIGNVLKGAMPSLLVLVALFVAKLVLTPLCLGGGFFGGVFAPALFIGAMLGAAYGVVVQELFPALQIEPAAYSLVGMAAMLAGAIHAPLTAIIVMFELTGDYHIILPLIFATTISLAISQKIERESVYTIGLARAGIHLDRKPHSTEHK
jgi:chloride channel protein, CIC family